jgi:hypothetical protein
MRARMLAATMVWLTSAATAAAQPAFPESREREPFLKWLQRETDITPESVIAITPQAVTAIVSKFPAGGGQGPRVVIRAEALDPQTYEATGALSWHVSLTADCQGRRVRLGETTGYPERNLLGERHSLRSADVDWRKLEPGTALENAWRAACDPTFKGPFSDVPAKSAPPAPKPSAMTDPRTPAASRASTLRVAAARAPVAATKRGSGPVVQVGAAASEAEARGLLSSLGAQASGRETWIETATVSGRVWRRALVGGFSDGAEAARFCAGLKAAGRACFVRPAR